MKTEDIKKMAQAWLQVQEASKKKMDPVDQDELKGTHAQRKDKDINNDGKSDKTDEYLHNRRKAVSAAIKGKKKDQEVEVQTSEATVNELKKSTLSSYIKKASGNMAGKTAVQVAKVSSSNSKPDPDLKRGLVNRMKGIGRAADKLAKESVDLGEDSQYYKSVNHEDAAHAHRELASQYREHNKKGFKGIAKDHENAAAAHEKAHEHIGNKKYAAANKAAEMAKRYATQAHAGAKLTAGSFHRDSGNAKKDSELAHKAHAHLGESVNVDEGRYIGTPDHSAGIYIGKRNSKEAKAIKKHLTDKGHEFTDHSNLKSNKEKNQHVISMKTKDGHAEAEKAKAKHGVGSFPARSDKYDAIRSKYGLGNPMNKKESVEEAATHKPGVASPAGEGLSPSAKKELARKTPMPDFVNEPKIDKKTFDSLRSSMKTATARPNDNKSGDKNVINKPADITAKAAKKEDDGFKDA